MFACRILIHFKGAGFEFPSLPKEPAIIRSGHLSGGPTGLKKVGAQPPLGCCALATESQSFSSFLVQSGDATAEAFAPSKLTRKVFKLPGPIWNTR
jgi:hypothetical protein